jgi:hypothetical protein
MQEVTPGPRRSSFAASPKPATHHQRYVVTRPFRMGSRAVDVSRWPAVGGIGRDERCNRRRPDHLVRAFGARRVGPERHQAVSCCGGFAAVDDRDLRHKPVVRGDSRRHLGGGEGRPRDDVYRLADVPPGRTAGQGWGQLGEKVASAIADQAVPVVGVVINAIDDATPKNDPSGRPWTSARSDVTLQHSNLPDWSAVGPAEAGTLSLADRPDEYGGIPRRTRTPRRDGGPWGLRPAVVCGLDQAADLESPSMGSCWPEMVRPCGPARKRISAAMSTGSMNCFTDWLSSALATSCS